MDNSIKDIIKKRRSVRTFNGKPISNEDKQKLTEFLQVVDNPFGVSIEFRLLNAKEHELSSPVIIGTDCFVAAKVNKQPLYEIAYGYSFEKFCLQAERLGLGTVMLAGTLSRRAFEKAMELRDNEVMPVATPIGYPAEKMSIREKFMRKAIKADERVPFGEIFFENTFTTSLSPENAGKFSDALEMLRLAPSAVNKQPWRAVVCGNTVHFFVKHAKGMAHDEFDVQKIDIGIALAHFDLTLKENGIAGNFTDSKPSFELEDRVEYIISYEANN